MHVIASSTAVWYAARAGGVVAYILVTLSVLAGILLAGKKTVPGLPRFAVEDVHRFLGLLAAIFIGVHVGSIALDSFVPFSLRQLVVPFSASYRPLATGLGVVALELLLAVGLTNRLRRRLPYRLWRRAHYLTFAVWALATVHGVLAGTDRHALWLVALYAVGVASVAGAAAARFGGARGPRTLGRAAGVAAAAAAVALVLAAVPQPSPPKSGKTAAAAARVTIPQLNGRLTGTIENGDNGIVSISGTAGARSAFRIDLLTNDGQAVADNALQLRFPGGSTCAGTLTSLDSTGFRGTCSLPTGATRTVRSQWTVSNGTVSGTIATSGDAAPASTTDA